MTKKNRCLQALSSVCLSACLFFFWIRWKQVALSLCISNHSNNEEIKTFARRQFTSVFFCVSLYLRPLHLPFFFDYEIVFGHRWTVNTATLIDVLRRKKIDTVRNFEIKRFCGLKRNRNHFWLHKNILYSFNIFLKVYEIF